MISFELEPAKPDKYFCIYPQKASEPPISKVVGRRSSPIPVEVYIYIEVHLYIYVYIYIYIYF